MLTDEEQTRVAAAIRDAESRTAGEIVVVVAAAAGAYRSVPLLYALLGSVAAPWPLIWLTELSAARIVLVQLVVALALVLLVSSRSVRWCRASSGGRAAGGRRPRVSREGAGPHRGRTGVLIYVAAAEHYAEVVADAGIAAHVAETVWREAITELVTAIRAGRAADGLVAAIGRVGAVLAQHAPARSDDHDELPNKVILI